MASSNGQKESGAPRTAAIADDPRDVYEGLLYTSVYKTNEVILHIDEARSAIHAFAQEVEDPRASGLVASAMTLLERLNSSTKELQYPNSKSPALSALQVLAKDLEDSNDAYAEFAAEIIQDVLADYAAVSIVAEKSRVATAQYRQGFIVGDEMMRTTAISLIDELDELLRLAADTDKLDDTAKGIVEQAILPQLNSIKSLVATYFETGDENATASAKLHAVSELMGRVLKASPIAILSLANAEKAYEALEKIIASAVAHVS